MFIPKKEFAELTAKITADCESLQRSVKFIIAELGIIALFVYFTLGVEIGKHLAR